MLTSAKKWSIVPLILLSMGLTHAHPVEAAERTSEMQGKIKLAFRLASFSIKHTMSHHLDTDYVYFNLKVGSQTFERHEKIGDLNDGDYTLQWRFDVLADPVDPVMMTYVIVNNGHADTATQQKNEIATANDIQQYIATVGSVAFPPAAAALNTISSILNDAKGLITWIVVGGDSDGVVCSNVISTTVGDLANEIPDGNSKSGMDHFAGNATNSGRGSDADYYVGYYIENGDQSPPPEPLPWERPVKLPHGGYKSPQAVPTPIRPQLYSLTGVKFGSSIGIPSVTQPDPISSQLAQLTKQVSELTAQVKGLEKLLQSKAQDRVAPSTHRIHKKMK